MRRRHPDAAARETSRSAGPGPRRQLAAFRTSPGRRRRIGVEFEPGEHEVDEHLPVVEVEVPGQGLQVVEEGLARGQFSPHPAVGFVAQVQNGVKQERQQVEQHEEHRQVLLAVAEIAEGPEGSRSS